MKWGNSKEKRLKFPDSNLVTEKLLQQEAETDGNQQLVVEVTEDMKGGR